MNHWALWSTSLSLYVTLATVQRCYNLLLIFTNSIDQSKQDDTSNINTTDFMNKSLKPFTVITIIHIKKEVEYTSYGN